MKKAKWVAVTITVLSILLGLISCRKHEVVWKGVIEKENGVTVIRNPKEPLLGKDACSIKKDLLIGGSQAGGEHEFSEIIDLAVDEEGNIYILDSQEACIRVFDKVGIYLRTIGKKGQGPGEMQRPMSISITPGNEILVNDRGGRFLHFFGLKGEHLRSMSLARMPFFSRPKVDAQYNIVARSGTLAPSGMSFVLAKFDPRLNELFRIFSYDVNSAPNVYDVFPPECFWAVGSDDSIVWGYNDKYEIHILDRNGNIIRRILKEYNPVKTTEDERKDWVKFAFGGTDIPPEVRVNWPNHHHAFHSLDLDDLGRVFVQTYEKAVDGRGYYYDVFDSEGKYVARILLNAAPRALKNGKLYTIEEDEKGYQAVRRYKVIWSGDSARSLHPSR